MSLSIFIFRRDLRLTDNTGLINCLKNSNKVMPIFIFDPRQLVDNKFRSDNCIQFMIESLKNLDEHLKNKKSKLYTFYGIPSEVIEKLIKKFNIDSVYVNMDYTPFSIKRDNEIGEICEKYKIKFNSYEDILLNPVASIKTTTNKVYSKFTPYYRKAKKYKIEKPISNKYKNYYVGNVSNTYPLENIKYEFNNNILEKGGRDNGVKILNNMYKFENYNKKRNCLNYETTHLSAYNKFGCVSIREEYWKFRDVLGMKNDLIKQLYWRDFYYNIIYCHPYIFERNFKEKYNKIKWLGEASWFNKWKKGETGYPIVDAAMRQLNCTGFMHNRARMIVASFLIKTLLVDWRKGELYFATKLYDYDPAQNNGGWSWTSGSGSDSQPYFRIFNPHLQSKKYDPEAKYIKRWIPELAEVSAKEIHNWEGIDGIKYPKPIVDYKIQKEKALKMYKKIYKG